MKKTLVALAVTAFAASASAVTVYENEGSKIDFDGSLRLKLDKNWTKVSGEKSEASHTGLGNDGSRFGVRAKHQIAEDFYALGRLEFRFDSNVKSSDRFGDLNTKRAYVGLGSKQYGELTFGRQITIADDIAQVGFDYVYGAFDNNLTTAGNSVVRYDYKGIEGLQVGVNYNFADRDADNVDHVDANGNRVYGKTKNGYGVGAVYSFAPAEGQSATVAAGYTRDNYTTAGSGRHYKDAWAFGFKYGINQLTAGFDVTGDYTKNRPASTDIRHLGFRVGAKYQVTPAVSVYGNYGHGEQKVKTTGTETTTYNRFMLGTDYQLHKNVVTYLEGAITTAKVKGGDKTTNSGVAVGLRVFW
ncbi:outer membrane protein P2-like protein [Actinobacillus indolicus]|nr:outer membrane protein P2-like protein [Actinobacillus indolicus]VTU06265.1 outer membrane protein P2-like protein [Actinobacillus indolicus]